MDNLCAMIDVNRLGQSDPAPLQHDMEQYRKRMVSLTVFLNFFENITVLTVFNVIIGKFWISCNCR